MIQTGAGGCIAPGDGRAITQPGDAPRSPSAFGSRSRTPDHHISRSRGVAESEGDCDRAGPRKHRVRVQTFFELVYRPDESDVVITATAVEGRNSARPEGDDTLSTASIRRRVDELFGEYYQYTIPAFFPSDPALYV